MKYLLPSSLDWVLALSAIGLVSILGYQTDRTDFFGLTGAYWSLFVLYIWVITQKAHYRQWQFYLGLAVCLRIVLLFSMPALSDDVYRFVWDGRLLAQGINPFDQIPSYYLEAGHKLPGLTPELYGLLNSPQYHTVYPPIAQLTFGLGAWLSPKSLYGHVLVMKACLLCFELGILWLLPKLLRSWKLPPRRVLWYALNPLILVELMGNLHFEGGMIFFLLLGIYCLQQKKWLGAALALAFSVASKLLTLLFLPYLIRRLGWGRSTWFFALMGSILLLLFFPLYNHLFLEAFGDSLNLYFQKFEFNASFYYLARWLGYQSVGYNLIAEIGPAFALFTFLGIFSTALLEKRSSIAQGLYYWPHWMLFGITLYLAGSPTVHPWYVSLPLVLCLFTRFRYPILWSGLTVLTYYGYQCSSYCENLWLVALVYILVWGCLLLELVFKSNPLSRVVR